MKILKKNEVVYPSFPMGARTFHVWFYILDSGSLHSVATAQCAKENKYKWKSQEREFMTTGGNMNTKYESKVKFHLSEFSKSKIINWNFSLVKQ